MLILTRRIGESIIIGNNIKVSIQKIKGNQVTIGIDAPPEITVNREEIHNRIFQEKNGNTNIKEKHRV